MLPSNIERVDYCPEYALEIVKLWRQSFQHAMGIEEHNRYADLSGQLDFFKTIRPDNIHLVMNIDTSEIAGFMVLDEQELDHLYIHVDYQGLGLGTYFIQDAKTRSPMRIELYTFQKNTNAQRFYNTHGFKEIARGFAGFEDNPWTTSKADLADIRYRWTP